MVTSGTDRRTTLITGGIVADGTGAAAREADVVVVDGVIRGVLAPGSASTPAGADRIDCGGALLAPGFIDVHSHADNAPLLPDDDLSKIRQGVTTEVTGNCGKSLAPVPPRDTDAFRADLRKFFGITDTSWHSTAECYATLDARGYVVNTCPLVGHGSLRAVMGAADRPATDDDLRAMGRLLQEALAAGAFGLSSGLIYPAGMFSDAAELAALASYLPPTRVYATHMRNESNELLASIDEALSVARAAGCRLQISHLKAGGRANWGAVEQALDTLDQARAEGINVTQDVYPYPAASTWLATCLPPWVHAGGDEQAMRRLHDAAARERMRADIEDRTDLSWDNLLLGTGGYDGVLVSSTRSGRREGRTLAQIAEAESLDPFDALLQVLIDEQFDASIVEFCMADDDVEQVLAHPSSLIGSDGLPPGRGGRPHPRVFGTFPRFLGHYVRERGTATLTEAVRRMTSLPAQVFGIPDRGRIAEGLVADLVCFDPDRINHPTDYLAPDQPPQGIGWVMQAGHVVVRDGQWNGTRRGARLVPA